ncbi:Geranyl transferase OS=Stutzerimonas stutzeri OX=316 GN=CXK95_05175 PE=3 SV=1 [Stutzerimonas stutzeri]
MVGGQAIDLGSVGLKLDREALELMHRHKEPGALIEASVQLGALASGHADADSLGALARYARAIGLAFQVQDDILDVEKARNAATLGKHRAPTSPATSRPTRRCSGWMRQKAYAIELRDQALHALRPFDIAAEPLRDLARFIVERRS